MKTKRLITCALFTAIICVTAPFCVMIGPVPITFTIFALALCAFTSGSGQAAVSTLVYILAGAVGMPVFSGFKGGLSAIMSPTGGFVFSYVFVVLILGVCKRAKSKRYVALLCALALAVCYAFGVLWYMLIAKSDAVTALMLCVVPFIPFDILKLYLGYAVSKEINKKADLFS